MSNLIPIKICELAIENLNRRIAELETENNRLRAETTRTIIPESDYLELKESYSETHTQYDNLCKEHRELREKYDAIVRDKIPPTSEYQKLVDKNCELKTEANFWREEYGKLLIDFNLLKQCPRQ